MWALESGLDAEIGLGRAVVMALVEGEKGEVGPEVSMRRWAIERTL